MDPILHTLIAVGSLLGAYLLGGFLKYKYIVDEMLSALLDKLERDGFIAVEEDDKGEKELIPVSEIVAKSVKKAVKEVCHGK
tara:strand:+ start:2966 stop:3211 length:246 start_codon:yes stop_codon:yes gene_type:complete